MNGWEMKPTADKTWAAVQTYFTKKWEEQQSYNTMTAIQTAFQEAELQAKEEAIAEETALLFTLQQEAHDKEMKAMKEALESMKGEIARLAKQSQRNKGGNTNNENSNPNAAGTTIQKTDKETKGPAVKFKVQQTMLEKRALFLNCKCLGKHRPEDCLEMESNKEKRNKMWASKLDN
jgi:hypothetical protein